MNNSISNNSSSGLNSFLISELVKFRLVADLKRSFMGWLWLLFMPLISMLIWLLMKNSNVIQPGDIKISYVAFLLIGVTLWGSFYDIYKSCSQIFVNYGKILLVNKFPIQALIVSEFIIATIKFTIPFVFILIYFLISGTHIHSTFLLIYFFLTPYLLLGCGIGLLVGLLASVAKDFSFLMDNLMRFVMFLSPVIYDMHTTHGLLENVLKYNPLTYFINSMRACVFGLEIESFIIVFGVTILSLLIFGIIAMFFIKNTHRILERSEL